MAQSNNNRPRPSPVPPPPPKSKQSKDERLDPHRQGSVWSITNMPKEIAEFAIDQPVKYDVKASEIKKHLDIDKKDEFEKAIIMLQGKEWSEKVYVAERLMRFITSDELRTFKQIIPAIENELKNSADINFHLAVAESTVAIVQFLIAKQPAHARHLITIAAGFVSSNNNDICEIWAICLCNLIEHLTVNDVQKEIVPFVLDQWCKPQASTNAKRTAGKLLGLLAMKMPDDYVSKKLFPAVEMLCKDKEALARGTMCIRLPEIISKLREKEQVFPALNNLLHDQDPHVMAALVGALGKSVVMSDPKNPNVKDYYHTVIPIFKKFVKQAYTDGNTELLVEFTRYLGPMAAVLAESGIMTNVERLWFLDAYLQLSRYGLPETDKSKSREMPPGFMNFRANMEFNRRHSLLESLTASGPSGAKKSQHQAAAATLALIKGNLGGEVKDSPSSSHIDENNRDWVCRANIAAGFPDFIKFSKTLVDFKHGLHTMIADLIHDPVVGVRAKMAEQLYRIMDIIGTEQGTLLHGEFVYALSDDNVEVVEAVIPQVANIMQALVKGRVVSPEQMTNSTVEVAGALLFCEMRLSQLNDWRCHAQLLEQLTVLPFCLPGDHVYTHFVPALFHRLLHMRQLPCRMAAADAIVAFLRHCRRSHQREDIRRRIKEGFASGRSVHDRMLYLYMSKRIMEVFSRKYFRDHFFETTLNMTDDNIANVRLKAVKMMPDLKRSLKMSDDDNLLKKLEDTIEKIKNSENDADVSSAIEDALPEMAKIGVVLKKDFKGPKTKEDLDDEAKEMEEKTIASMEPPHVRPSVAAKDMRQSIFKTSRRSTDFLSPPPKSPSTLTPTTKSLTPGTTSAKQSTAEPNKSLIRQMPGLSLEIHFHKDKDKQERKSSIKPRDNSVYKS